MQGLSKILNEALGSTEIDAFDRINDIVYKKYQIDIPFETDEQTKTVTIRRDEMEDESNVDNALKDFRFKVRSNSNLYGWKIKIV